MADGCNGSIHVAFDVETGPLELDVIKTRVPAFEPAPAPGEFDESTVKYGNLKDKEKRLAKLEECRAAHVKLAKNHGKSQQAAEAAYYEKVLEKSTLDARLSRVIALVTSDGERVKVTLVDEIAGGISYGGELLDKLERKVLAAFWAKFEGIHDAGGKMACHNCYGFDLPFMVRRSLLLNLAVPPQVIDRNRFWSPTFVDTMEIWRCGERQLYVSLGDLGNMFGVGGKLDGVTGDQVHKLMSSGREEDRELARKYTHRDGELTFEVARCMGVFD